MSNGIGSNWKDSIGDLEVFEIEDLANSNNNDSTETTSGLKTTSGSNDDTLKENTDTLDERNRTSRECGTGAGNGSKKSSSLDSQQSKRSTDSSGDVDLSAVKNVMKAIALHDLTSVKTFLSNQGGVDTLNKKGQSLLMSAVEARDYNIVEELLLSRANVNHQMANGITALHLASRNGDNKLVERLLAVGAQVNVASSDGTTPLHCACQSGSSWTVVRSLLNRGADIMARRSRPCLSGIAPVHDAAEAGDTEVLKLLLDQPGCDVHMEQDNLWTALHIASKNGHVQVIRELIAMGADITRKATDTKGSAVQAIHLAVENNEIEAVRTLLEAGSDVNVGRDYFNRSRVVPLHLACMKRNIEMVSTLIELGAEVNACDVHGTTALHLCAKAGLKNIAQLLLKHGADLNITCASKQSKNQTPLHLAVRFRHHDTASFLIRAGCTINASEKMVLSNPIQMQEGMDRSIRALNSGFDGAGENNSAETVSPPRTSRAWVDGYTPLHWAVENGDLPMVCLLLDNGADANKTASFEENSGVTPLHLAAQDGYNKIAEELLRVPSCDRNPLKRTMNRENITPLHQAVYNGHVETVRVLVEHGCDSNIQADNGYAALHYAAQQGNLEMTTTILKHGGDARLLATAKDQLSITPLHLAVQSGNDQVVSALSRARASIDAGKTMGSIQGVTPLHQAVYQEKTEIVALLIELGANVNCSMAGWYTAAHVAAEKGCIDILRLLLQHSANVNARASHGEHQNITPLHVAAQNGRSEAVRTLVEFGANLRAARRFDDRSNITPLHLAAENGFADTVKVLLELGSDLNAQDSMRFTPLHLAVQYKFPEVVKVLLNADCDTKRKTSSGLTAEKMAEQMSLVAIRTMITENRMKTSNSLRSRKSSNSNPTSDSKKTTTSRFLHLLCGLKRS